MCENVGFRYFRTFSKQIFNHGESFPAKKCVLKMTCRNATRHARKRRNSTKNVTFPRFYNFFENDKMGNGQAADEGGLATFLVPLRHPETHETYSGLTIGDMGLKDGLNGVDNGFLLFDNYRLPPEAILSRPNSSRKGNNSLSGLSMGRVGIVNLSNRNLHMAVVIAVRYSAVRRQFGPSNSGEHIINRKKSTFTRVAKTSDDQSCLNS